MKDRQIDVKMDIETESDEIFALLDEVISELKDNIDNLMNISRSEFVLKEILENELGSDDVPLNLLVPEANYHVAEHQTNEKKLRRRK